MKGKKYILGILSAALFWALGIGMLKAQNADISLEVEPNETLKNSQSISIQSLVGNSGSGPTLFRMHIINSNSEYANNLYLQFLIRSEKVGLIGKTTQVDGQPFSLSPGQQVSATNNSLHYGLPGVEEAIQFQGEFTPEGRTFVNNLNGSTTLPPDRYTLEVNIFQGSNRGNIVATASAALGSGVVEDTKDFYLLSPGGEAGSENTISNPYPSFQWQGDTGSDYRVIVVEAKGEESPQSLFVGAESTDPIQRSGSPAGGSLLDHEMLDVVVSQSSYQYPNTGVQELEAGKTYYWRIINLLQTSSGEDQRRSEIWEFTLTGNEGSGSTTSASPEITNALKKILGDRMSQLGGQGLDFNGIEIDGQIYRGGQALQKLRELSRQAEQGDISIVIEQQ